MADRMIALVTADSENYIGGMHTRLLTVAAFIFYGISAALAQDLDSNLTDRVRNPGTIADEISDGAERNAFLALYNKRDAKKTLEAAQAFMREFPQSSFLAQASEIAARSSFDQQDYSGGLVYARQSLELFPENSLLLIAVADAQSKQFQDNDAITSAHDALEYLDRFVSPISIGEHHWPEVKRREQAIAYFAIGRAELHKSLMEKSPELRRNLLIESETELEKAHSLNATDEETTYLLGGVKLSTGKPLTAATDFASVYRSGGLYATKALDVLQRIYGLVPESPKTSFATFLKHVGSATDKESDAIIKTPEASRVASTHQISSYAGSAACKECHYDIYQDWEQTGMAKMLRPYEPQNVIGDFTKNNEYYTGADTEYLHGEFDTAPGGDRKLFARMVLRNGRHYFDIKQSDGQWHSYAVDYTIGSKWQQAYATKSANGDIHVLPIEYNVQEKKWLNYWKSLDGPGTERSDPRNFERLDDSTSYWTKCAICHTSQLSSTAGAELEAGQFKFREPGIGCEMCHGPSALHVSSMNDGTASRKGPLDAPVDFGKIGNRDFVKICAQCHMQSAVRDAGPHGELNYSRGGTFFKEELSVPFDEFSRRGFYKDGRFNQTTFIVEALERSKCFRKGQVSCGTCHDPHGHGFSANPTSLKYKDQPDQMCTGCHTQFRDKIRAEAHTHHATASEGSRCISCHMPRIMDALGFDARTHQIDDIPNAEMTLRFGQRDSPNACLLCHAKKDAKWVQIQLLSWKGSAAPTAQANTSGPAIVR